MSDGKSNRLMLENLVCPVTQGTLKFDKKSNEITAIIVLLGLLDIKGSTIFIEAMGT